LNTLTIDAQFSMPRPLIVLSCLAKIYYTVKFEFLPLSFANYLYSIRVFTILE